MTSAKNVIDRRASNPLTTLMTDGCESLTIKFEFIILNSVHEI